MQPLDALYLIKQSEDPWVIFIQGIYIFTYYKYQHAGVDPFCTHFSRSRYMNRCFLEIPITYIHSQFVSLRLSLQPASDYEGNTTLIALGQICLSLFNSLFTWTFQEKHRSFYITNYFSGLILS